MTEVLPPPNIRVSSHAGSREDPPQAPSTVISGNHTSNHPVSSGVCATRFLRIVCSYESLSTGVYLYRVK